MIGTRILITGVGLTLQLGCAVRAARGFEGDGGEAVGTVFGCGRLFDRGLFRHSPELVDVADNQKQGESYNEKINDGIDKKSVINRDSACFLRVSKGGERSGGCAFFYDEKQIGKIGRAQEYTDAGHEKIIDK